MDFQTKNMQAMNAAQQAKDTAVINGLMKDFPLPTPIRAHQ
jgi:hypothetical protein